MHFAFLNLTHLFMGSKIRCKKLHPFNVSMTQDRPAREQPTHQKQPEGSGHDQFGSGQLQTSGEPH